MARHAVGAFRWVGLVIIAGALVALWLRVRRARAGAPVVVAGGVARLVCVVLGPVAFPWYAILHNGHGLASRYHTAFLLLDVAVVLAVIAAAATYRAHRHRR